MVVEPVEKMLLETQKKVLIGRLAIVVKDAAILKEIKELTGTDVSFKSALKKVLLSTNPDPLATEAIRSKVTATFPDATAPFDELINVCRRLAKIDNPMIVN